jgi:chemotaxis protein methyltransferase CheR
MIASGSAAEAFTKLRDLVYERTGLYFEDKKRYLVERRIDLRVEAVGATNALDYYQQLRYGGDKGEFQEFVESLTTHETYFFREYPTLQSFADDVLQNVLTAKRRSGDRFLRIWSAGCSSGEEPYTLAIILREVIDDFDRWQIELTGTDISRAVLRQARRATYTERSLKDVPTSYRQKYFRCDANNEWVVTMPITRLVKFRHANLQDGAVARELSNQDFIFCRNVLIYFEDASRRQVVDLFYDALRPGGSIFLGHSESVGRITTAFRAVMHGKSLVYEK